MKGTDSTFSTADPVIGLKSSFAVILSQSPTRFNTGDRSSALQAVRDGGEVIGGMAVETSSWHVERNPIWGEGAGAGV